MHLTSMTIRRHSHHPRARTGMHTASFEPITHRAWLQCQAPTRRDHLLCWSQLCRAYQGAPWPPGHPWFFAIFTHDIPQVTGDYQPPRGILEPSVMEWRRPPRGTPVPS